MRRDIFLWLIKAIILFVILLVIVQIGKELKPTDEPRPQVLSDPLYEESLAKVNKLQQEIELQIRIENEKRAKEYIRSDSQSPGLSTY